MVRSKAKTRATNYIPPLAMEDKVILQLIAITIFIYASRRLFTTHHHHQKPFLRSVAILVLGDIGRSPRIMYHAESFAKNEYETFLIGYAGAISN
jgi:beta-1,4-mannosyltransferase